MTRPLIPLLVLVLVVLLAAATVTLGGLLLTRLAGDQAGTTALGWVGSVLLGLLLTNLLLLVIALGIRAARDDDPSDGEPL
ncbi:MAG: hypothetical protein CMJ59_26030 [Planctomycetaceae bacterium]|nr:hypothetical protein [Planctomycetaceae bacterium]